MIDSNDRETLPVGRTDCDIIMDNILDDSKYACENIIDTNEQRLNKDMVFAMAVDICLWEGTFCKYCIQNENGKAVDNTRTRKSL